MAQMQIRSIVVKKFRYYAKSTHASHHPNLLQGDFHTTEIIVHSALGDQYTSRAFEDYLDLKKMIHSFSRKANPYDNACIESFHSIVRKEEVNHRKYADFQTVSKSLFEFIEAWYNRKRIHGSIGYLTP